ncbi:FkbM family methyltransferase [Lentibacter sp. XHP0401]|uniref:FkbM family methyltransferase n=1 Tax=Lentibacter sp. XHP0401 TaxID=2984334 RepID=UPI0021E81BB2|nr:FkbM family methyltransferase [Lentibacter sp. XHP0401]MCV2893906.1 FkbM family methyltransferase [Lentibacter sp. XHP0401]
MGVKVPPSPYLTEKRIERINAARYEGQEIAGALHVVGPEDRVVEMGAGLGIVGAVTQCNARPAAMVSFEANPNMIPHIEALYALNRIKSKITLHNKVLLTEPEPPESVDFFLRNSFLGSSLTDSEARETTAVSIPTAHFEELRTSFKPTVLLMDIEGGELDFLRHANLEGIRAIVLEFHPEAYGKDGMRECKDILRKAGFSKVNEVSTRLVWTCLRGPDVPKSAPDPEEGWSRKITEVEDAIVVPPAVAGLVQPTGVLTAKGAYVNQGALWRRTRPLTEAPAMPETVPETLEGTWLWGGQLWLHFGHFLAESTPRLWGLQAYEGKIDGILFTPKRPRNADLVKRWQWKFLEELAPGLPVRVAKAPTRVERLIVPGQGFGLGKISRGTPEFRTFIAGAFGATISPSGPDKLYISRSKFEFRKGSLVGEGELETQLAAQGYEIFHPQEHDIATQIARYKAASHIIAAEGSAIHLAAMVMGPHQKLAIVVRRRSSATDYIETHLQSFAGVTALSVDALVRSWMPEGERKARHAIGEIDFPSLQNALLAGGFIEPSAQVWENFSQSGVQELLGGKFRPV